MPHNTGDGHLMAREAGAKKGKYSVMFFGPHQHPYSSAVCMMLRHPTVMNVNLFGDRFSNESIIAAGGGYQWMSGNALNNQKNKTQYSIMDYALLRETVDRPEFYSEIEHTLALIDFGQESYRQHEGEFEETPVPAVVDASQSQRWLKKLEKDLEDEAKEGRVFIEDTVEGLAEKIGCDKKNLRRTVDTYNAACKYGYDAEFAKKAAYLKPILTPPFYAIKAWQGIDTVIGGIAVNHNLQVLDTNDDPIPGLYASGIGTSGAFGGWYSYPGSESSYAMASGFIAGEEMAGKFLE